MADNYQSWYITSMFTQAQAAALQSGNQLTFTRMIASSDVFQPSNLASVNNSLLSTMTISQSVSISEVAPQGASSVMNLTAIFNNTGLVTGYAMNTIVLTATYNGTEIVAAIQLANTAYTMPAQSSSEIIEYTIKAQIVVSNTAAISLTIDGAATVTQNQFNTEIAAINTKDASQDSEISALQEAVQNNTSYVDLTSPQTITAQKTFNQPIIGNITGNAETATNAVNATNAVTAATAINATNASNAANAQNASAAANAINASNASNASYANTAGVAASTAGNAATASKLQIATTINGVTFDGSAPIAIPLSPIPNVGWTNLSLLNGAVLAASGSAQYCIYNGFFTIKILDMMFPNGNILVNPTSGISTSMTNNTNVKSGSFSSLLYPLFNLPAGITISNGATFALNNQSSTSNSSGYLIFYNNSAYVCCGYQFANNDSLVVYAQSVPIL